jgi:hypothetical protein
VATCPECDCEFDDPVVVCPHCDVPLVNRDEEGATEGDEDDSGLPAEGLVVIETTCEPERVEQIRELLEETGIPCFLSDELWPVDPPPEETKVLVPREMSGEAKRLVRDYFNVSEPAQ